MEKKEMISKGTNFQYEERNKFEKYLAVPDECN